ncbi:MAG: cache domain-containing protein [Rhodocyclaceae bacterium]
MIAKRFAAVAGGVLAICFAGAAVAADSATPEEVMVKVREAASFLHQKGASGFAEFNNSASRWVWKDSYVFVYDCRMDRVVAHPFRPDLVGQSIAEIKDNSGKFIFRELCKAGNGPKGGWVDYMWTKPGAGNLSRKVSYARSVDVAFSSGIQVSAGVYDDKVSLGELQKALDKISDPTRYPSP